MQLANDHLGEKTQEKIQDESNSVIDENRIMDVSSTVKLSINSNSQKE